MGSGRGRECDDASNAVWVLGSILKDTSAGYEGNDVLAADASLEHRFTRMPQPTHVTVTVRYGYYEERQPAFRRIYAWPVLRPDYAAGSGPPAHAAFLHA